MKKVSIYKQNNVLGWQTSFETEELAQQWLDQEIANGSFGKSAHYVNGNGLTDEQKQSLESHVETISGQEVTLYLLPAEFTYEIENIVPYTPSQEELNTAKWIEIRSTRDSKLLVCDWTQLADSPMNSEEKQRWRTYRQSLRDVPQNIYDIAEAVVVWPLSPTEEDAQ